LIWSAPNFSSTAVKNTGVAMKKNENAVKKRSVNLYCLMALTTPTSTPNTIPSSVPSSSSRRLTSARAPSWSLMLPPVTVLPKSPVRTPPIQSTYRPSSGSSSLIPYSVRAWSMTAGGTGGLRPS
jgi:hypothetical protein